MKLSDTFVSGRLAMHIDKGILRPPNDLWGMDFGILAFDLFRKVILTG